MRRFRRGATKSPTNSRPGAGYGRICFGAPRPMQDVEPLDELVPELFTGEKILRTTQLFDYENIESEEYVNNVIDLTTE